MAPLLLERAMREGSGFPDRSESRLARVAALKEAGNDEFGRQQWRKAADQYSAALQAAPNSVLAADAFNNRAAAHAKLEEWDAAFMNASFAYRRLVAIAEDGHADGERTLRAAAKAAQRALQAALRMCPGHAFATALAGAAAEALKGLLVEAPCVQGEELIAEAEEACARIARREADVERRRKEAITLMEEAMERKRSAVTKALDGMPISFDADALPSVETLNVALQASCSAGEALRMVLVDGPAMEGVGFDYEADWGDTVSRLRPADPFADVGGLLTVSAQFNPQCRATEKMLRRRNERKAGSALKDEMKTLQDEMNAEAQALQDEMNPDADMIKDMFQHHVKQSKRCGRPLPDSLPASFFNSLEDELPLLYLTITVKGFVSANGAMRYFVSTRDGHSDLPPLPDGINLPFVAAVQPRVAAFAGDAESHQFIDDDLRCVTLLVTWKRWWIKLTANFSATACTAADSLRLMTAAAQATLHSCSHFRAWPERRCGRCSATLADSAGGKCARCECIAYCGSECQSAHWAQHRKVCKRVQFEWDRNKAGMPWRERQQKKQHAMLDAKLEAGRSSMGTLQANGKVPDEFTDVACPQM
jgi:hypothetical protein